MRRVAPSSQIVRRLDVAMDRASSREPRSPRRPAERFPESILSGRYSDSAVAHAARARQRPPLQQRHRDERNASIDADRVDPRCAHAPAGRPRRASRMKSDRSTLPSCRARRDQTLIATSPSAADRSSARKTRPIPPWPKHLENAMLGEPAELARFGLCGGASLRTRQCPDRTSVVVRRVLAWLNEVLELGQSPPRNGRTRDRRPSPQRDASAIRMFFRTRGTSMPTRIVRSRTPTHSPHRFRALSVSSDERIHL